MEMNHGLLQYFGQYFVEKSHGTNGIRIYFRFANIYQTPLHPRTLLVKNEPWQKLSVFSKKSISDLAG